VLVEVLAEPWTRPSRIVLDEVVYGLPPAATESQCGFTDDRVPSNDPRAARLLPVGCTGWIIHDCQHCLLTAGHCVSGTQVVQFNVPLSSPSGALNHPSPDHQYAVDAGATQGQAGGIGNDWARIGAFPNSNTALTPFGAQGLAYFIATPPPLVVGAPIRVTGFGVDSSPPDWNQIQQTHVGPWFNFFGTTLQYITDTTGGNSGSPVIHADSGVAIGIHTNAGCNSGETFGNQGTGLNNPAFIAAMAAPTGVCVCNGSASVYCTAKVNSQGCLPAIASTGTPSATGGAGSFTISASLVLNNQNGYLVYSYQSANTPFNGGTLCLGGTLLRTGVQNAGGNPGPADCSGTYSYDMGARIASGIDPNLVGGVSAYAQYLTRDPLASFGYGMTDAITFVIGP
jgi:V8-like Glu-specific endopeptidase